MSKIVNHELTLRQITVPVEYRKGSYSGRYELYIDDLHIGWVVKFDRLWEGYLTAEQTGGHQEGRKVAEATRHDAVDWLVYKLGDYARTNVLASRAEAAYADAED